MTENQKKTGCRKAALIGLGVLALLCAGLGGWYAWDRYTGGVLPPLGATTTPAPGVTATGGPAMQGDKYSLQVELSEGEEQPQAVEVLPPQEGEPLSDEEIAAIAARLPDLPPASDSQTEFKRPVDSLPPPRPGQTVEEQFPPASEAAQPAPSVETGPVQVLRFAPQGDVPLAPFISVTFNQPMVPLGTLGDLADIDVPVKVEPSLPGTWRWLGTRTLTFQSDSKLFDRLPMATEYRVTIPAGTKSASGQTLAEEVAWTFKTPPPTVVTTYPYSDTPQPLKPLFFVSFDQRIDPAAVLEKIQVTAGSEQVSLVLATQEEIDADKQVSQLAKNAEEGRWLAFRATQPFKPATSVSVIIPEGTPSAEGPLTTMAAQSFGFSTYYPLEITEHRCGWYDDRCPPFSPFYITFNNPLDLDVFDADMIQVDPEIGTMSVNAYGNTIEIKGETKGRTTYSVTVSGNLRDVFGQRLEKDSRVVFKVDKSDPILIGPGQNFLTLDPTLNKPALSVYAINYDKLHVKVQTVQPADWPAFKTYLREWQRTDNPPALPGANVMDKNLSLDLPADTLSQVDVDLSQFMAGKSGQFVVIVEPPPSLFENDQAKWRRFSQTVIAWVQVTQIGLDAFTDHSEMIAWATDLKTGAPLAGVSIKPNVGAGGKTGDDGIVRFDIPSGATYLVAETANDLAILPRSNYYYGDDAWVPSPPNDALRWYVFDDRGMYKPGEEVHIKGWIRKVGGRQSGDVGLVGDALTSVSYQLTDPMDNSLLDGSVEVNALGGFDFAFTIPANTNLGFAQLYLSAGVGLDGRDFYHPLQVQEFRRPEFEVSTRTETEAPYFAGDHAVVAVDAKYYAGGALPNADAAWTVTTSKGSYSPPNWDKFTFGSWTPWWWFFDFQNPPSDGESQTFVGKTDAAGTHRLRLDFKPQGDPANEPSPMSVTAEASVMDINRQAWNSSTAILVHPSNLYVGIRTERYFVERGKPLKVEFIVTDLDGNPVSGRPVKLTAARLDWVYKNGGWTETETEVQTCETESKPEPDSCVFETPVGGSYQITATVTDEQGRKNQSRFRRWVSGGRRPAMNKVEMETVTLVPDLETYQPGDTAQILVQSPFTPAEGLLTVSRSGILYTERFKIEDGSTTLEIPIKEEYIPNLNIRVDLTGSAPRTDENGEPLADLPHRPAYASAELNLKIPPLKRTLSLEVSPTRERLEPGSSASLTVSLKDANGEPVPGAEVAVVVVDEAILALTNYKLSDPIDTFYQERPSYLFTTYGRANIILADPQTLAGQAEEQFKSARGMEDAAGFAFEAPMLAAAPMATVAPAAAEMGLGAGNAPQPAIAVRTDFNSLANFSPSVKTDANGKAQVYFSLPDNLTRYRIMAVAVDNGGKQFGIGESNLTARLPLMVRPSAPRFLNFGDKFELPVVLQNQTDEDLTVDVIARASNLEVQETGKRVTVPANDRIEVRFPASTVMAGAAKIQFAAVSGEYADAATVELPVYTPATSEAFAVYGVIDEGALAQPVQYPTGVFPQFGGLEVTTSSTALQALTDAVLYLTAYPFECSEQLASRVLAIASLRDVLTAFKAEGLPSPNDMEFAVSRDIERLRGLQNYDGGFPYWRRGFESVPFNTIHVAHALVRAQQKGFDVPADTLSNAQVYLQNIENYYPYWYSQETRWTLSAYALYVRNLMNDRDAAKASTLLDEAGLEALPMEAIGWLWSVIDNEEQLNAIRAFVNNHVVETAGAAN
ncbi:MAG: Ig-like domain-containing protein, partial [Chloroflexi bacterium]|nr:Ig-like domain-containing protein [Chloroflexota bacterium]